MTPENDLLARVKNGALDDFEPIVQKHQALVFSIVGRYERDPHKIQDLAQETFLKAWRALAQYDPDRAPFAHWLSRIAVHVALDHLRREKRVRQEVQWSTLGESADDWIRDDRTEQRPDPSEAREILDQAMCNLSAEERLVITLLEIEERSIKEIAALTGWSAINVRVRAYRARTKLRRALDDLKQQSPTVAGQPLLRS